MYRVPSADTRARWQSPQNGAVTDDTKPISPAPFCGDCHRARISADGTLYTCLFAAEGQPLRATLQQGEDALVDAVAHAWTRRADRYSEIRGAASASKRHVEMYLVGG